MPPPKQPLTHKDAERLTDALMKHLWPRLCESWTRAEKRNWNPAYALALQVGLHHDIQHTLSKHFKVIRHGNGNSNPRRPQQRH